MPLEILLVSGKVLDKNYPPELSFKHLKILSSNNNLFLPGLLMKQEACKCHPAGTICMLILFQRFHALFPTIALTCCWFSL